MDPTSYRIPIIFDESPTPTGTHSTQEFASRRRKQSTSSEEYEFQAQPAEPLKKKARRPVWLDDSKIALLQCRLHLNRIFENNDEAVAKLAWDKIAAMLDMACTGDDCIDMFDSLVKKYLKKQQADFHDVSSDSSEWQQYQTLEKLFLASPKLAALYESVELNATEEEHESTVSEDEPDITPDTPMNDFVLNISSNYNECFVKFCEHVKDRIKKQKLRETKLMKIVKALIRIREENMFVVTELLKRILFRFNDLDHVAKRESLEAVTSIFPGIFSVSSVAISTISNYLKSSTVHSQILAANTAFLMNFTNLISQLIDSPDEEDEFYLKSLPSPEQYFDPNGLSDVPDYPSLSDFNFKGHLHISRTTIEELIQLIGYFKSTRPDPLKTRVSIERQMTLFMWYLTHNETYEQLALRFSVLSSEIPVILRHLVVLLAEDLAYIIWPQKDSSKMEVVKAFESMRPDSFPGVIGALGTTYFSLTSPAWFINDQGKVWKEDNLKQDIAVQAIADTKYFFTSVHIAWLELPQAVSGQMTPAEEMKRITRVQPGEVFYRSPFHVACSKKVKNNPHVALFSLPSNLHVVADVTYPVMESVMVPYDYKEKASPSQVLFDQVLNDSRSVIDVAFGKLINRFSRLSFLDSLLQHSEGLIKACIGIHNFCVKEGDDFEAKHIELPERQVKRVPKLDEGGFVKRKRICQEIYSGKINYAYRDAAPLESVQESESVPNVDDAKVKVE